MSSKSEVVRSVLVSASQALVVLSKARCVTTHSFPPEERFKLLYSWPSLRTDEAVASFLLNKKIIGNRSYAKVKSYRVPHAAYKTYEKSECPAVDDIQVARTLLDVFHLSLLDHRDTELKAVWDTMKHPMRPYPRSMREEGALEEFSRHDDSILAIRLADSDYYIKLPAYAYRALRIAAKGLDSHPIEPEDRSRSVGVRTDDEGRTPRFIVHRDDAPDLSEVLGRTAQSIRALVGSKEWVTVLEKDGKDRDGGPTDVGSSS